MAEELKNLNPDELNEVTGGADGKVGLDFNGPWKKVMNLKTGWLALRTEPVYDYKNEIGQLKNGDDVQIVGNLIPGKIRRKGCDSACGQVYGSGAGRDLLHHEIVNEKGNSIRMVDGNVYGVSRDCQVQVMIPRNFYGR